MLKQRSSIVSSLTLGELPCRWNGLFYSVTSGGGHFLMLFLPFPLSVAHMRRVELHLFQSGAPASLVFVRPLFWSFYFILHPHTLPLVPQVLSCCRCVRSVDKMLPCVWSVFIFPYHIVFLKLAHSKINFLGCTILTALSILTHIFNIYRLKTATRQGDRTIPTSQRILTPIHFLSPWQPFISFLSLYFHVTVKVSYKWNHLLLLSDSIMHLGFIHTCVYIKLFFYCVWCVPYWPIEGQLGCFEILAAGNRVAVNIHAQFL